MTPRCDDVSCVSIAAQDLPLLLSGVEAVWVFFYGFVPVEFHQSLHKPVYRCCNCIYLGYTFYSKRLPSQIPFYAVVVVDV